MSKLVDLSHSIESGMVTYKGLPAPIICDYLSRKASESHYAKETTFHVGKIEMVANTGTYIDAPFHRYAEGKDISELALEVVANLDGVVIRINPNVRSIGKELLSVENIEGKAVLIRTGWSRHWRTDQYFEDHPFLTEEAAIWLRDSGASLVGIDSLNIDSTSTGERPVHSVLLAADIPIVEHMCNLEKLPVGPFRFSAVPVKVKGFGSFPVRAFATLNP